MGEWEDCHRRSSLAKTVSLDNFLTLPADHLLLKKEDEHRSNLPFPN